MKKLFYLLACALMVAALPACNVDKAEEEQQTAEQLLVNSWKLDYYIFTVKVNDKVQESSTGYPYDNWGWMWTFRADGSFIHTEFDGGSVNGQSNGTWLATSNQLILNYSQNDDNNAALSYTIKSISASELVVIQSGIYEEDGYKYEETAEYHFLKQK